MCTPFIIESIQCRSKEQYDISYRWKTATTSLVESKGTELTSHIFRLCGIPFRIASIQLHDWGFAFLHDRKHSCRRFSFQTETEIIEGTGHEVISTLKTGTGKVTKTIIRKMGNEEYIKKDSGILQRI